MSSSRVSRAIRQEVRSKMNKTPNNNKTKRRSTIVVKDQHITLEIVSSSLVLSNQVLDCEPHNDSFILDADLEIK